MKILMLSWEYPHKNLSRISDQIYYLSNSLKNLGHEVHIITCFQENKLLDEDDLGLSMHRVIPYSINTEDFTKSIMHFNYAVIESAVKLINEVGRFDIIHAYDWRTAYAAKLIKGVYSIPMICTINDTEHGRNGGIRTEVQSYISSIEWMLTYESWKVITCSNYEKEEINKVLSVPENKIFIVPNEVKEDYTWDIIALNTIKVYEMVKKEAKGTEWGIIKEKPKKKSNTSARKRKKEDVLEVLEEKAKSNL